MKTSFIKSHFPKNYTESTLRYHLINVNYLPSYGMSPQMIASHNQRLIVSLLSLFCQAIWSKNNIPPNLADSSPLRLDKRIITPSYKPSINVFRTRYVRFRTCLFVMYTPVITSTPPTASEKLTGSFSIKKPKATPDTGTRFINSPARTAPILRTPS